EATAVPVTAACRRKTPTRKLLFIIVGYPFRVLAFYASYRGALRVENHQQHCWWPPSPAVLPYGRSIWLVGSTPAHPFSSLVDGRFLFPKSVFVLARRFGDERCGYIWTASSSFFSEMRRFVSGKTGCRRGK
ncbi:unnamed protein product, partial [Ectocarpus sp. 12 AP-2014]